jgi:hypothetical protein
MSLAPKARVDEMMRVLSQPLTRWESDAFTAAHLAACVCSADATATEAQRACARSAQNEFALQCVPEALHAEARDAWCRVLDADHARRLHLHARATVGDAVRDMLVTRATGRIHSSGPLSGVFEAECTFAQPVQFVPGQTARVQVHLDACAFRTSPRIAPVAMWNVACDDVLAEHTLASLAYVSVQRTKRVSTCGILRYTRNADATVRVSGVRINVVFERVPHWHAVHTFRAIPGTDARTPFADWHVDCVGRDMRRVFACLHETRPALPALSS